jgi:hypothetical protein
MTCEGVEAWELGVGGWGLGVGGWGLDLEVSDLEGTGPLGFRV